MSGRFSNTSTPLYGDSDVKAKRKKRAHQSISHRCRHPSAPPFATNDDQTMRLPLLGTILSAAAILRSSHAFNLPPPPRARAATSVRQPGGASSTRLYYEPGCDPPSDNVPGSAAATGEDIFNVLAKTEKWVSETLRRSNRAAAPGRTSGDNPYSRKEVTYVCESAKDQASLVAGIFRRVRDAREMGEAHASEQEENLAERGSSYGSPTTIRQTNCVVLPYCEGIDTFHAFDTLIGAVNQARRNARDYVTDVSLEKVDDSLNSNTNERDWVVSISCAHLHPKFGEKTAKEILAEMEKEDEEDGPPEDVDVNYEEMKKRRQEARQAPYPTIVLEVMASPPPNFNQSPPPSAAKEAILSEGEVNRISGADVQKLEALFGQSAATDHPTSQADEEKEVVDNDEEAFWNSFGKLGGIEEVSAVTPTSIAHKWVAGNEPSYDETKSTFVATDARHVDEAYEFVFSNIASQKKPTQVSERTKELVAGKRSYLVMPNFLSSSATSFEKFAMQVSSIVDSIPGLTDELVMSTLHPETVETEWRSPVPILILQWYDATAQ